VVLLGAGLDTRAYRLDWPPGCTIFEIDQEGVLAFKGRVLDGLRAAPKAERVTIGMDLRLDWATALTGTGFDPAAPTANRWVFASSPGTTSILA
jgi:methyltransferase (TIGR00027 family)